ncbi:MAG: hypothetical protein HUJ27_07770 [Rhodobacteraceae bacterium]|nr:hypothetical protein [Paracoccaceae bacterium]
MDLFRGDPLEDLDLASEPFEEWLAEQRRALRAHLTDIAESGLDVAARKGDWSEIERLVEPLLRMDPLNEKAIGGLMRVADAKGRKHDALELFETHARKLQADYQAEPSIELTALRDEIAANRLAPVMDRGHRPEAAIFERPPVLLLGFENLGGGEEDNALALGLAQEVRTSLCYWRWFPVIGPEAVGWKTAHEIDLRRDAAALGAAYAVSGSLRRAGQRVRISVNLSSVTDGSVLWSQHFDGTIEDVFDFEEQVSRSIVAQIEPEVARAEASRIAQRRPADLSSWQLMLRAGDSERRGGEGYGTRETNEEQKRLVAQVLEKDPDHSRAWSWLAKCHWRETLMGWVADRDAAMNASIDASQRALDINPTDWEARAYRALTLLFGRWDHDPAEFHAAEAVRLNPSSAMARHGYGCVLENAGNPEAALEQLNAVFRLDPNHPNTAGVLGDISTCNVMLARHDEAVQAARRMLALAPGYSRGLQRAASAFALAGEDGLAREAVEKLFAAQPDFSEDYVRSTYPFREAEHLEMLVDGLRRAGAFR